MALKDTLPRFILKVPEIDELITAEQQEVDLINNLIASIIKELNIATTTDLISRYEQLFDITHSDIGLSDRRDYIKSFVRSRGTASKSFLQSVAQIFNCGDIEVVEDPSEYTINIKFTSLYGVPSNMDDFKRAMRDVIPAHLVIAFVYSYMTWLEFDTYHMTWSEWDSLNLTWAQFTTFGGV